MTQFDVINGYLCVVDTTRWDYFYGFRKGIRRLK